MRLKKGFTLAEILIVLMVIGVIATLTIPSLMRGVNESQYKTAYKKAYNAVVNLTAMERISGQLPSAASSDEAYKLFASLNSNLSVKEYAASTASGGGASSFGGGNVLNAGDYSTGVSYTQGGITQTFGTTDNSVTGATISSTAPSPWIVTEDNLAYAVVLPTGASNSTMCGTKLTINGATTHEAAAAASCAIVVVDVNGLSKGPNRIEPQVTAGLTATTGLSELTGDQYYIYVGLDGATAGPKKYTVSGRLVSDIK